MDSAQISEQVVSFSCQGEQLLGIVHHPSVVTSSLGVLLVVGGPQYRVGSHRQFVLLARSLEQQGIPVFRFDYRGMGDGSGEQRDFSDIDDDIAVAIDSFYQHCPELQGVVIWGLCDAASAAAFYAWRDPRVHGLVLLNPWVRTDSGEAKAYLKHYYLNRLMSGEFWRKVFRGGFNPIASFISLFGIVKRLLAGNKSSISPNSSDLATTQDSLSVDLPLPERMLEGLRRFDGPLLFILSGNDLTADEFREVANSSEQWQRLMSAPRVTQFELKEANHTFSTRQWRGQVESWTSEWIQHLKGRDA